MAGSVNPSVSRSNMVRSCSAVGCANRDTKENDARGIRFYRIPVDLENGWPAGGYIALDAAIYSVHLIRGKCMQKH